MLLIRTIGDEADGGGGAEHGHGTRPQWMRVIAMEIMRGYVFFLTTSFLKSIADLRRTKASAQMPNLSATSTRDTTPLPPAQKSSPPLSQRSSGSSLRNPPFSV